MFCQFFAVRSLALGFHAEGPLLTQRSKHAFHVKAVVYHFHQPFVDIICHRECDGIWYHVFMVSTDLRNQKVSSTVLLVCLRNSQSKYLNNGIRNLLLYAQTDGLRNLLCVVVLNR